jgi:hypothetical protein
MKREKINNLYALLKEEVAKAQKAAKEAKRAADEIAKSSYNSPSQSGDRFHSQGQADITMEVATRFSSALKKVEEEVAKEIPEGIAPTCFIELAYKDGTKDGFYYLDEPITLSGIKIISSNSPFAVVLAGKKIGDSFEFVLDDFKKSGKIISIE